MTTELKTWEKLVMFVGGIVTLVGMAVLSVLVMAIPTWLAWNAVMPYVFNLKPITFGQAMLLLILAEVLFKVKITPETKKP